MDRGGGFRAGDQGHCDLGGLHRVAEDRKVDLRGGRGLPRRGRLGLRRSLRTRAGLRGLLLFLLRHQKLGWGLYAWTAFRATGNSNRKEVPLPGVERTSTLPACSLIIP